MEKCEAWVSSQQPALQTATSSEDEGDQRAAREMSAAISRLEESLQKLENKQVKPLTAFSVLYNVYVQYWTWRIESHWVLLFRVLLSRVLLFRVLLSRVLLSRILLFRVLLSRVLLFVRYIVYCTLNFGKDTYCIHYEVQLNTNSRREFLEDPMMTIYCLRMSSDSLTSLSSGLL